MVSLSTTLTTNSVVEDLGAPVCVLLPGYTAKNRSGKAVYWKYCRHSW